MANIRNRAYIDSISAEKVYLGYTYQSAKEKEINLGLDLKGGMNVMLQVQLQDLVKALAGNSTDPDFQKALDLAKKNNVNSSQDFIGLFESAWAETANGRRLAEIFGTYELRDRSEERHRQLLQRAPQPYRPFRRHPAEHPAHREQRQDPHRAPGRQGS